MASPVLDLDLNNLLDFSIQWSGFLTDGDEIIFSEWFLPPELCLSDSSWNGTISTAWITPSESAVEYTTYDVLNRVYSSIEAVAGTDLEVIDGSTIASIVTDLSEFEGKNCIKIAGFSNPLNNGDFVVLSATTNTLVLVETTLVAESAGSLACVTGGRVIDKSFGIKAVQR